MDLFVGGGEITYSARYAVQFWAREGVADGKSQSGEIAEFIIDIYNAITIIFYVDYTRMLRAENMSLTARCRKLELQLAKV